MPFAYNHKEYYNFAPEDFVAIPREKISKNAFFGRNHNFDRIFDFEFLENSDMLVRFKKILYCFEISETSTLKIRKKILSRQNLILLRFRLAKKRFFFVNRVTSRRASFNHEG